MNDRRSIDRERKYRDDPVCGITFDDVITETYRLLYIKGFIAPLYDTNDLKNSHRTSMMVELTAFAAMNLLRRRNGLEPLTEVPPLIQLAEAADE